ncbi:hypothetical protein C2G38_2189318 [Gigaspora rosea]|uniref:Uncharacterized protein n=1 Tax=Gigaspora rosea TaxID=44941 RepID=A0A397V9K9_9GLOM|nr:hypothetical protein C2G38_2189318 [Gigaspora rosea]
MTARNAQQMRYKSRKPMTIQVFNTPTPKVEEQRSNLVYSTDQVRPTYYRRQEKFDKKFTQDLLNKIREIAFSSARDITNKKGSLEEFTFMELPLV